MKRPKLEKKNKGQRQKSTIKEQGVIQPGSVRNAFTTHSSNTKMARSCVSPSCPPTRTATCSIKDGHVTIKEVKGSGRDLWKLFKPSPVLRAAESEME